MKKAFLFDLDGTLLNTTKDIGLAMGKALGTTFTDEQINRYIGNGLKNAIKTAAIEMGLKDFDLEALNESLHTYYRQVPVLHTAPFPGVTEILQRLQDRNIPVGIYSNKEQDLAETVVHTCFRDMNFAFIAGQHGKYEMKPSPQAIFAFCETVGVGIADTLYVGDSEVDYRTARNAGIDRRILTCGSRTKENLIRSGVPADEMIDSFCCLSGFIG